MMSHLAILLRTDRESECAKARELLDEFNRILARTNRSGIVRTTTEREERR